MGGCRCSYKNCIRATKNSEKDFHFFHYPVKDPERCLKWITNAKKPNFQNLPEDQLRNKVVCQLHFENQYFTNANRKRLVHDAVPTLDAGSEDTVLKNEEINVQVLQSDSEGNVFTVDTDTLMQTEVGDVTSYVIRNGNLVPADLPDTELTKSMIYKVCVPDGIVRINDIDLDSEAGFATNNLNHNHSEQHRNLHSLKQDHWSELANSRLRYPRCVTPAYESPNSLKLETQVVSENTPLTETQPFEEVNILEQKPGNIEVINLSKTIEQHSKEIASLKRILNANMKRTRYRKRLTTIQIINHLRGLIPATLHGAISLHLLKKDSNFTKDEKSFLISLYTASPAAYEILLKDCKWKLPNSDVVKELIISDNCFR
ncbi:hypothetical protein ILUMI_01781 [Ignelater luminosus]|uniref:THAP-type domain-containing protein n=1 Tax=Ignelater luminosus TaxID=2038154 RepID=A0A8K0DHM5_IGNLU|nr:hypothetical protein ILUMI_01781 [Ignelater luminosus]